MKVEGLEKFKKEVFKKEKKATKKLKQFAKKEVTNNNATAEDDFNTL